MASDANIFLLAFEEMIFDLGKERDELRAQLALAKQVAIQSQEDAKAQYRKCVALENMLIIQGNLNINKRNHHNFKIKHIKFTCFV